MNSICRISVAKDFSSTPIGRYYPDDGPFCGQAFREQHLLPLLKSHERVQVDLDGTEGYGSSFLEEAFGGLVRVHGLSAAEVRRRIDFLSSEDPTLIDEITEYIDEAVPVNRLASPPRQKGG